MDIWPCLNFNVGTGNFRQSAPLKKTLGAPGQLLAGFWLALGCLAAFAGFGWFWPLASPATVRYSSREICNVWFCGWALHSELEKSLAYSTVLESGGIGKALFKSTLIVGHGRCMSIQFPFDVCGHQT